MRMPVAINIFWHPDFKDGLEFANTIYQTYSSDVSTAKKRSISIPIFFYSTHESIDTVSNDDYESMINIVFVDRKFMHDSRWTKRLTELFNKKRDNDVFIPVAIERRNMSFSGFGRTNFLRAYDYHYNQQKLLALFTSICKHMYGILDDRFINGDKRLKLFISHTRADFIDITERFRKVLDLDTNLKTFFDKTDIYPSEDFGDVITKNIETEETIFLALMGDNYINRSWCKREIATAKINSIPILVAKFGEQAKSEFYPYLSNVSYLDYSKKRTIDGSGVVLADEDIYDILVRTILLALERKYKVIYLESFKKHISSIDNAFESNNIVISPEPPEPMTILSNKDKLANKLLMIYPDPPIIETEIEFIKKFKSDLDLCTPLTWKNKSIGKIDKSVMISISDVEEGVRLKDNDYMADFFTTIIKYLILYGTTINYGGNLKKSGSKDRNYVEMIYDSVSDSRTLIDGPRNSVFVNYIANYLKDRIDEETRDNKYEFMEFLDVDPGMRGKNELEQKCYDLTRMREQIASESGAAILMGGRNVSGSGFYPGIIEEFYWCIEKKTPVYIIGTFGGAARAITEQLTGTKNIELEQKMEDSVYSGAVPTQPEMLKYLQSLGVASLNNGLSDAENIKLFNSRSPIEAVELILKGLSTLV